VVEAGARGAALLAGCAAGIYAGATAVPRPHAAAAGAGSPRPGAVVAPVPNAPPGAGATAGERRSPSRPPRPGRALTP
jgi:hypothetical protein